MRLSFILALFTWSALNSSIFAQSSVVLQPNPKIGKYRTCPPEQQCNQPCAPKQDCSIYVDKLVDQRDCTRRILPGFFNFNDPACETQKREQNLYTNSLRSQCEKSAEYERAACDSTRALCNINNATSRQCASQKANEIMKGSEIEAFLNDKKSILAGHTNTFSFRSQIDISNLPALLISPSLIDPLIVDSVPNSRLDEFKWGPFKSPTGSNFSYSVVDNFVVRASDFWVSTN